MVGFTENEEQLLNLLNNNDLYISLINIKQANEMIWASETPRIVQDFTDHGSKHSERVTYYLRRLLSINNSRQLSPSELYLLLAGAYIHDIGMQCDVVKYPMIRQIAERLGAKFDIDFSAKTSNTFNIDEQKLIRKNHQYLTAAWIDYANRTGETVYNDPFCQDNFLIYF